VSNALYEFRSVLVNWKELTNDNFDSLTTSNTVQPLQQSNILTTCKT